MRKVGILLIMILLVPFISTGSEGQTNEEEEVLYSSRIKEIYFGPKDDDNPPDGLYDIYDHQIDNLIFTFQLLKSEYINGNETGNITPLSGGKVILKIQMGDQVNISRKISDYRGRVHFNFTTDLKDDTTGETFHMTPYSKESNITISIKYLGNDTCTGSERMRLGDFHDFPDGHIDYIFGIESYRLDEVCCMTSIIIMAIVTVVVIILILRKKK